MNRNLLHVVAAGTLLIGAAVAQTSTTTRTPPDPATMAANQVARLTKLLTLTTAQQAQATTIFTAAAISQTSVRTGQQTAQASLQTAITKNDTATIDTVTAQIGTLTGQQVDISSKAQAAFYAILTADQQTQYSALPGHGGPGSGPGGAQFGPPRQ